jgi:transposase
MWWTVPAPDNTTIGLYIAKNVFQVHGMDAAEKVVVRKQFRRSQVLAFFTALLPCLVWAWKPAGNPTIWYVNLRAWPAGRRLRRLITLADVSAYAAARSIMTSA